MDWQNYNKRYQEEQKMMEKTATDRVVFRNCLLSLIALVVGGGGGMPCHATLGHINLEIKATIVAATCSVSADSKNKTIEMGTWGVKQFTATPAAGPVVPFTINLENCGAGVSGVVVTFTGNPDSQNKMLLALNGASTASHLGLALLDHNRQLMPLGRPGLVYGLKSGERNVALIYYAQYYATGGPVTAGSANADATFSLEYQ